MRILIVGLGAIGVVYGSVLRESGCIVEHALREGSASRAVDELTINLLDGRVDTKRGVEREVSYPVTHAAPGSQYDLILCPVGNIDLRGVVATLRNARLSGPILLLSGEWDTRAEIDAALDGIPYVMGYPVAGGRVDVATRTAEGVLFDHLMLESPDATKADLQAHAAAVAAFTGANVKIETPYDMLEWIWIHMAINAAVISEAARGADFADPASASAALMADSPRLRAAIAMIREAVQIVAARGVDLSHYRADLLPYRVLPAWIAAPVMKRMFATNELTRRIMLLHANPTDLLYVCGSVYDEGQRRHVSTPRFTAAFNAGLGTLRKAGQQATERQ